MVSEVGHGEDTAEDALVVAVEEAAQACEGGDSKDTGILEECWEASYFAL